VLVAGMWGWARGRTTWVAAPEAEREVLAGIATIVHEPTLRTLVGLYGAQTLVAGALNVLVVVTAFELLDLEAAGVGLLYAAIGAGGLIGGFVALVLAAGGRGGRGLAGRPG